MSFETPILLIVFNRPDKTQKLFEKIKTIRPKKLFVSADGPRENFKNDKLLCNETREIFKNIDWDCESKFKFSEKNLSCKTNVIDSINWFFSLNEETYIRSFVLDNAPLIYIPLSLIVIYLQFYKKNKFLGF